MTDEFSHKSNNSNPELKWESLRNINFQASFPYVKTWLESDEKIQNGIYKNERLGEERPGYCL